MPCNRTIVAVDRGIFELILAQLLDIEFAGIVPVERPLLIRIVTV
jgi:hypothetical protein